MPPIHLLVRLLLLVSLLLASVVSAKDIKEDAAIPPHIPEMDEQERSQFNEWYQKKYHRIVRQICPKACGAAALATVLKYEMGLAFQEDELLAATGRSNDEELSVVDIRKMAQRAEVRADAYFADIRRLDLLPFPGIVLIEEPAAGDEENPGRHYVVLQALEDGNVWIKDPRKGNTRMRRSDFMTAWTKNKERSHGLFIKITKNPQEPSQENLQSAR